MLYYELKLNFIIKNTIWGWCWFNFLIIIFTQNIRFDYRWIFNIRIAVKFKVETHTVISLKSKSSFAQISFNANDVAVKRKKNLDLHVIKWKKLKVRKTITFHSPKRRGSHFHERCIRNRTKGCDDVDLTPFLLHSNQSSHQLQLCIENS